MNEGKGHMMELNHRGYWRNIVIILGAEYLSQIESKNHYYKYK